MVRRPVPVVTLPLGATEDRVLGTLDLEAALHEGRKRFEPGLLARAHRGILYIDEVNLLEDHLVDILLDVAATGVNLVERESVSFSHPARFLLVGTMNPEEGELRPQLLDRFGVCVEVKSIADPAARAAIVRQRLAFEADPVGFLAAHQISAAALKHRLELARDLLPRVEVGEAEMALAVRLALALGTEGHRADLTTIRAACTLAALDGRTAISRQDVKRAAVLALRHRMANPLDDEELDTSKLVEQVEAAAQSDPGTAGGRRPGKKKPLDREAPISQGAQIFATPAALHLKHLEFHFPRILQGKGGAGWPPPPAAATGGMSNRDCRIRATRTWPWMPPSGPRQGGTRQFSGSTNL